jgi:DNA repair photolyase
MKIKEIRAKNIITKSGLPGADFVINPYVGCWHGCSYCYARFMKKFTGHMNDKWGGFVDVKLNASELISDNLEKYKNKCIVIGSVTDPYQKPEEQFEITRKILKKIKNLEAEVNILTKSDLIIRDIDLLKKFKNLKAVISLASMGRGTINNFEKNSVSSDKRLEAIKRMAENDIYTVVFISPILPYLTNWKEIIKKTEKWADEYWFENLNLYQSIKKDIFKIIKNKYPEILEKFKDVYEKDSDYWNQRQAEIVDYCQKNNLKYKMYFHHSRKS